MPHPPSGARSAARLYFETEACDKCMSFLPLLGGGACMDRNFCQRGFGIEFVASLFGRVAHETFPAKSQLQCKKIVPHVFPICSCERLDKRPCKNAALKACLYHEAFRPSGKQAHRRRALLRNTHRPRHGNFLPLYSLIFLSAPSSMMHFLLSS